MNPFLEPQVQQYGSSMVMTGVQKPTKKRIMNVDTRFTDEYIYPKGNFNGVEQYIFTLPQRLTDVRAMRVRSVEIPVSFSAFSAAMGNSAFAYKRMDTKVSSVCVLPDGNYASTTDLVTAVNTQLYAAPSGGGNLELFANPAGNLYFVNNATTYDYILNFAVDVCGNDDKYQFRSKLGWAMGFRDASYGVVRNHAASVTAESAPNFNTVRYLYLVVDEFSSSFPNSFLAPLDQYMLNKKILARICVLGSSPYGTVLSGNEANGVLVSDVRTYQGKIDIQKLSVQLVNEWGVPVNLQGLDFSFALEIEHE